ncbi:hypothetical protein SDC9_169266 [bioreactor metagenome]|uniref:Uncharacterized protein n=1 Tax=bioreactor metagenome TaxID=1076179 RepID=A0A645GCZ2_9ZZZZ
MALVVCHNLRDFLVACRVTNTPSRHGIGFGHAVNQNDEFFDIITKRCDARMGCAVVDQLFIYFIRYNIDIVFYADFCDLTQFVLRIEHAGRIARTV